MSVGHKGKACVEDAFVGSEPSTVPGMLALLNDKCCDQRTVAQKQTRYPWPSHCYPFFSSNSHLFQKDNITVLIQFITILQFHNPHSCLQQNVEQVCVAKKDQQRGRKMAT